MYAIIPAKLHSTSCPAKNGRPLAGISLIMQAVSYARQEGVHPIISTPDGNVAALAHKYDIPVFYEPETNQEGDILGVIRKLMEELGACRYFSLLQPTSPFRQPGLLAKIWRDLRSQEQPHGYFTARKLKLQGRVTNGNESHTLNSPRRQINPNWVYPADGNISAWHRDAVPEEGFDLLTDAWDPVFDVNPLTHLDIDTESDFALAAALADTPIASKLLPARKGMRIAIVSNCPMWDRDVGEEVDSHDLVVRINDLRSLDTQCTGKRTDIAYVLPGTNYIANSAETQHGDALKNAMRVVFARQVINSDESFGRMKQIVERHNIPDNWTAVEEGTSMPAVSKTTLYEATWHITREYPGCRVTIFGDRHAGTRALEHAGNIGEPEDMMMDTLCKNFDIKFVTPMLP